MSKKHAFTIRMPHGLWKKLRAKAYRNYRSIQAEIRSAIESRVGKKRS